MKLAMPSLDNITWERVERESSVTYPCDAPDQPGNDIVFGDTLWPRAAGAGRDHPAG
jgi:formate dehydrogenase major subunit